MIKCCECKFWKSKNGIKGKCLNYEEYTEQYNKFNYEDLVPYLAYGWDKKTYISLGTDWGFECKYGERKNEKVKSK